MTPNPMYEHLRNNPHLSCVIQNGTEIREFCRRGVVDLFDLTQNEPEFLHGATVADKIVGKGAAACMVLGGISELYTNSISRAALKLLQTANIPVFYEQCVDTIQNRTRTDICPVEKLCSTTDNVPEMIELIRNFLNTTSK
ncbi:MAG: DUF1893 domain-containing protein [Bacteroidales bacterium]|jgi:iron complex outermembrane receptor protein|nr:DUF1893 domain-containing protein [Bacteroidales bacterium]